MSNLRLSVQYYAKKWFVIKNYSFKSIDGKIFNYIPLEIKGDHDSSIRNGVTKINKTTYEIIKAIINSKQLKIKVQ